MAEIELDAAFSAFPGVERELVLLQGNGVRLRFEDGRVAEVLPPHGRVRFAGEETLHGELVDGTTHDFNLMWKRDLLQAELLHRPLVGSMFFFCEPGVAWALYLWPVMPNLGLTAVCRRCTLAIPRGWRPVNGKGMRCRAGASCWRSGSVRRRDDSSAPVGAIHAWRGSTGAIATLPGHAVQ